MPVVIGLLFHANFPFSMHYNLAFHSCYKHLPKIMREFPEIPINWHFSATLLQQLAWNCLEVLKLLREGIHDKQFEILGSAYAQNILYACSEWANQHQIDWNRRLLFNFFPRMNNINGFWNPERVFYKELIPLLAKNGFNYTLIENDILDSSLSNKEMELNRVWKLDPKELDEVFFILPDNQVMKDMTNDVIWSGNTEKFFKYLDNNNYSDSARRILCYAEDAEATGFWQFARGLDYKKAHDNLRTLLRGLEDNDWVEVKLLSDIIKNEKAFDIGSINEGQASWMAESVKVDGYKDWFDYFKNAPEIKYYKQYHDEVQHRFESLKNEIAQRNLAKEILYLFLGQQFEFGCSPGSFGDLASRYLMNVPGYQLWDDRVTIKTLFDWLNLSNPKDFTPKWKYRGSSPVIEWLTAKLIGQYSPIGGRCTLLLNREMDSIVSPNIYFPSQDRNVIYNTFPHLDFHLQYPEFEFSSHIHGNLLEDECFVNGNPIGEMKETKVYLHPKGRKYFQEKSLRHTQYSSLILPHRRNIQFWYLESNILIRKEIKQTDKNIQVLYVIHNNSDKRKKISFRITNEFAPNSVEILDNGINCLKMITSQESNNIKIAVQNLITLFKTSLYCEDKPDLIKELPSQFAKRVQIQYNLVIVKNEKKHIRILIS